MTEPHHPHDPELELALASLFDDLRDRDADLDRLVRLMDEQPADVELTTGEVVDQPGELVAVRSAATLEDRQVVINGGWADLVLDLSAVTDDRVDLRGTVLGVLDVCAVQLLQDAVEVALTVTDDFGEFALLAVPIGRYELVVAGPQGELSTSIELS